MTRTGHLSALAEENAGNRCGVPRIPHDKTKYASYDYTPYGEVYAHSGSDVKHRFTGQEWDDAAELYYFPFRYYSPETARWSVREPSGADGPNLYWYGFDTPVNGFDWLGLRFYFDNIDAITDIHSNWTPGRYGGFHFGGPANVGRPSSPGAAAAGAFFQGVGENTLSIFTPYSNPCEPTVGQAKLWGRVSLGLLLAALGGHHLFSTGQLGPLGYHYLGKNLVKANLGHLYPAGNYWHLNIAGRHFIFKLGKILQQLRYWQYLK